MGRNFISVCHLCNVQLMHFRGKEGDYMQRFANDHSDHEQHTEVLDDYVKEAPDHYTDVFDSYHRGTDLQSLGSEANSRQAEAQSGAGEKGRL